MKKFLRLQTSYRTSYLKSVDNMDFKEERDVINIQEKREYLLKKVIYFVTEEWTKPKKYGIEFSGSRTNKIRSTPQK